MYIVYIYLTLKRLALKPSEIVKDFLNCVKETIEVTMENVKYF